MTKYQEQLRKLLDVERGFYNFFARRKIFIEGKVREFRQNKSAWCVIVFDKTEHEVLLSSNFLHFHPLLPRNIPIDVEFAPNLYSTIHNGPR